MASSRHMARKWKVALLPGDGVGPELIENTTPILEAVNERFGISMDLSVGVAGFNAIEKYGTNLPEKTISLLKGSDCVLKGPMTTPEGGGSEISAAVKIRKMFSLYAGVRPSKNISGIKAVKPGVDLIIVRENTEGMYSGLDFRVSEDTAMALRVITRRASERIGKFALQLAKKRRRHLTIVHKGNILKESDSLFKESILRAAGGHSGVSIDEAHVDAMAQWLIKKPESYDVIVTENLFGDILSDEAAMIVGGVGVGPSANIGAGYAMFEPVHGSAPKYTGKDIADPVATILSEAMMYEWMGIEAAGSAIRNGVEAAISKGVKTRDLGGRSSTSGMCKYIAKRISK